MGVRQYQDSQKEQYLYSINSRVISANRYLGQQGSDAMTETLNKAEPKKEDEMF